MLRRYDSSVFEMDLLEFEEFCDKAKEKDIEDELRNEWCSLLPMMYTGYIKFISFADYRDRRTGANIDTRPASEIIAELEELHGKELT